MSVLAVSSLTPTLNRIYYMMSGVRNFDPNTGHLIGIKKMAVMVVWELNHFKWSGNHY